MNARLAASDVMHVQAQNNLKHAGFRKAFLLFVSFSQRNSKSFPSMPSDTSRLPSKPTAVPDGFALVTLEEGECIVPEYWVPATHNAFDQYRKRLTMNVNEKHGGVRVIFRRPTA